MAYHVPSVQIEQEFASTPVFSTTPLAVLVIGVTADTGGVTVANQDTIQSCASASDVATTLGTVQPSNPIAQGVYNALLNSNGAPVYYVALSTEGSYAAGVAAYGSLIGTATNVSPNDTVTIDGKTYTFKAALSATFTEGEVLIGAGTDATLANLIGAINHTGTPNTGTSSVVPANATYSCAAVHPTVSAGTSITSHTVVMTAKTVGTGGNSIGTTEVSTELSWSNTTLTNGSGASNLTKVKWSDALAKAEKSNKYYGIVPVFTSGVSSTLREAVQAEIVAHVEAQSTKYKAKWRTAWFSAPVEGGDISGDTVTNYIGHLGSVGATDPRRFKNVFPGSYTIGNTTYDGCFAAAALAGLRSGSVPHQSLTNTVVNLGGVAELNDVVNTYSETALDNLAEAGCWILTQDVLGGAVYTRHQITAEGAADSANLNYMEDSITANVDSISYGLQAALSPFKGTYNISPATVLKVRAAVDNELSYRAGNTWTERAGNQLISYTIISLAQDATFKDRINIKIGLNVPYPMNYIEVTLSI